MIRKYLLLVLIVLFTVTTACGETSDSLDSETDVVAEPALRTNADEPETDADAPAPPEDWTASLAAYVQDRQEADNIPGLAVALVSADDVLWMEGFGLRDVEAGLPVTPDTLFHIGSINKSMTALLAATLVDEGRLDWETPIVEIYPAFALADSSAAKAVTMRHLLGMTSGIPDYAEDDFDVENSDPWEMFAYLASVSPDGQPGETFSYSNLSASAAGYATVLAAAPETDDLYQGYADLLQQRLFTPVGMTQAVVRVSNARKNPNYGQSYVLDGSGGPQAAEPEDMDGDVLAPSGTVKASVADMARYIQTLLAGGESPQGQRVVGEETLKALWQPGLDNYGLGWGVREVDGETLVLHEGSYDNYLSVAGFWPELDLGFVLLTNSEQAAELLVTEFPEAVWEAWP